MSKLKYPRNEIWERLVYEDLIREEKLKVLFRPASRICDGKKSKCFYLGEEVVLKVLKKPGDDERGIEPMFTSLVKRVEIQGLKEVFLSSIKEKDCVGSYPNVLDEETLRYHLGLVYNKKLTSFEKITIIKLKYLR